MAGPGSGFTGQVQVTLLTLNDVGLAWLLVQVPWHPSVVLLPGAAEEAVRVLAALPQPFTLSAARQALGTTRRVAVPLLELLDRQGATRRLPDDRRVVLPV